jgi:hypothetical protein
MMFSVKNFSLLLLLLACASVQAAREARRTKPICGRNREACLYDENCLCYCSHICGFREKTSEDNPVYVPNDPYGIFCYCKPWDKEQFQNRGCARKERLKLQRELEEEER